MLKHWSKFSPSQLPVVQHTVLLLSNDAMLPKFTNMVNTMTSAFIYSNNVAQPEGKMV